jgi:hypothetical protein
VDRGPEGNLRRANLDGTEADVLYGPLEWPGDLALDVGGGKAYWTEGGEANRVRRANLDGTEVETLVATDVDSPEGIALDVAGGKMYWTEWGEDRVRRANLDGTEVETLYSEAYTLPDGIALDLDAGKVYWTEGGRTGRIRRANLDGTAVEDVATEGMLDPEGIALAPMNHAPVVHAPVPDVELLVGGTPFEHDLAAVFDDEDGDGLHLTARCSDEDIAIPTLTGSLLTVTPVAVGDATVTLTASDRRGGTVATSFVVRVPSGVGVDPGAGALPTAYALHPNYPNPFNPATKIRYALPEATHVRLAVYDLLGREVATLIDGMQPSGWHEATFEAADLPSGVYLYRLDTPAGSVLRAMMLVR